MEEVKELKRQNDALRETNRDLLGKLNYFKLENRKLNTRNRELTLKNRDLNSRINSLNRKLSLNEVKNGHLSKKNFLMRLRISLNNKKEKKIRENRRENMRRGLIFKS